MKKIIFTFLLLILFIPYYVNAETCNIDKISISSITIENKTENVIEIKEATVVDKKIDLNISVSELGDNIKYRIVIKNDSNEDYELDNKSFNLNSKYIDYKLESEDNSNIVKANSSKVVYLKVEYSNEVPNNSFNSGIYNDNKSMTIDFINKKNINALDKLKNPNTRNYAIYLITIILILNVILFKIMKKKHLNKFIIIIVGITIMIPISVYALCKYEIKVDSNVVIKQKKFTGNIYRWHTAPLKVGDTLKTYLVNKYVVTNGINRHLNMYDSLEACENYRTALMSGGMPSSYTCQYKEINAGVGGEYKFKAEDLNKNYYIKNQIVEDVVMASYVCFTFNNKEHCLKGADGGYSYNDNVEILREYMEYMNLPISNYHPGCNFSDSVSKCYSIGLVDGYRSIEVYSNGNIIVEERDGVACRIYPNINSNEESYCYEMPE